ncbi:efflux pump [Phlyctema vagabunda]|uniref:Efflux pump n=1 Tax=Phlyctema vagabunda TaxID=108571 RepID=A0ABR4PTY9_9HELO
MEKPNDEGRSTDTAVAARRPSAVDTDMSRASESEKQLEGTAAETDEHDYITGVKLAVVIASITLVCFLMMLDMSIVVTAIPRITSDFHSLQDVGWYGSTYLLSSCALQPLAGKIYTNFGTKISFLSFLGLFEFGSTLCGAAQSSNMLIIGRFVAGLGSSGLVNGALTIIAASAPMPKRPALMGIMMAFAQLGIIGGPLIGGVLTQYASWRWCFYINLPIGAVSAIFLLLIKIPDRMSKAKRKEATWKQVLGKLDLGGFVLFAPFATMFLMALQWGGSEYPWKSATIIGLFCGAGGMLAIFAAWESYVGDEAMIPYSVVRKKVVWSSCLVIGFFFGSVLVHTYYLPIYFQAVRGTSPTMSGVDVLPGILSQMLLAVVSGVLVGKLGYYLPWTVTSAILIAIASGLLSTLTPHTSTSKWIGYQLLAGFGRGCGMQMPIVAVQNILPPEQIPIGMSLIVFCQTFGGSLFLAFAQTIFNSGLIHGLRKHAPDVNPEVVITAGATAFRKVVAPEEIPGILEAYNLAINHNFYLAAGAGCGILLFAWGMGWQSIKKKKHNDAPTEV